jgi:chromosome segregation and condensation protein ScpB
VIRQLIRFGLVAAAHRAAADQKTVRYGTTPRFLELFSLTSLDDLPRLTEGS